MIVECF